MLKTLPVFIGHKEKNIYGLLTFLLGFSVYLYLNHFHFFPPRQLPWLWPDQVTPFVPSSLWLYLSIYLMMILAVWQIRDLLNFTKYFYSSVAHFLITAVIFLLWPTYYPRQAYPLPDETDILTKMGFQFMRLADTPANCCPSLHVSCAFLTAFLFLEEKREKFPYFFIWASLVAFSTMTTKQHYFLDVLGGFTMAVISYIYFYRFCSYKKIPE